MADNSGGSISLLKPRLQAMMFLEYAVRGLWLPLAPVFLTASPEEGGLGFDNTQMSFTLGIALAVGALMSPIVAGQVADRWFATQRFMGVLLLLGGLVKIFTAYQTSYDAWLWLSILYAVLFMPTLGLSNSLAMTHLKDPKTDFPGVRVWGTIGWIAVSWLFPVIWLKSNVQFEWLPPFFSGDAVPKVAGRMLDSVKVAGVVAIGYGLYSLLVLPHTPPRREVKELALSRAARAFMKGPMAILGLATLIVSSVHFLYFYQTAKFLKAIGLDPAFVTPAMSLGQFAEIAMMVALGPMLTKLGFRRVIVLGAFCYSLRYLVFGLHEQLPLSTIVASQALHGPCFACFYAASFIYVDKVVPNDVKHSSQTIFALICFGLGPLISSQLNVSLGNAFSVDAGIDYTKFWLAAGAIGLVGVAVLAVLFFDVEAKSDDSPGANLQGDEQPAR